MKRTSDILYRCMLIGSLTLLVDQLSKKIASFFMPVSLNTGISFGLLNTDHPILSLFLLLSFGVLLAFIIQKYWHEYPVSTGLFVGGAISNIVDRLAHGGVRDWFPLGIFSIRNNLADWAIFLAGVIVLISLFENPKKKILPFK